LRNHANILAWGLIAIFGLSIILSSFNTSVAQSNGSFPGGTFNGMQINYSISGIALSAPTDVEGFTTSRKYTGEVSGNIITASGTFHMDWTASVIGTVTLRAGSEYKSQTYDCTTNNTRKTVDLPFNVAITVPSDATDASLSISMGASYGNGEVRGLKVYGEFTHQATVSAIEYITLYSDGDSDYIATGSNPFTMRAYVYGPNQNPVADGTVVSFSLADRFGTTGDASIYPEQGTTVAGKTTVTFYPPSNSYWNDINHDPFASNRITVTASAGDKEQSYILYIIQPTSETQTPSPTSTGAQSPCIIATATYGGPLAGEVVFMRSVRDDLIGSSPTGSVLVSAWNSFYYSWSPPVAYAIADSGALKSVFSVLLAPLLGSMYVVAEVYHGLAWINVDLAAVVSFILAAALSIGIYIILPALSVRYGVKVLRSFLRRHQKEGFFII